jgi:F1F0 ATPase subunit 2
MGATGMNELLQLALVLLAGLLLGALFFGGLWWTVLKGVTARQPALWFGVSLLLRTGFVLAGFYLVSSADWKRLLLCLLGFIAARFIVIRLTDVPVGSPLSHSSLPLTGERDTESLRDTHETNHAP